MEQKLRFPDATSNVSHATKSKSRLRLPTAAAEGESVGEEESENPSSVQKTSKLRNGRTEESALPRNRHLHGSTANCHGWSESDPSDGEREGPVNFCDALTQDPGTSDEDRFCRGTVKNAHTHDLQ